MNEKKIRTPSEVNIALGGVLEVGIQASHQKMLKTIINPFWSNFEIILTPSKINKPETHLKLKKSLPNGVAVKKIETIPNLGEDNSYSDIMFTRIIGQSISIYPNRKAEPEEFLKPLYVVANKQLSESERRRANCLRLRLIIPTCWHINSFENSQANEEKVVGKDLANTTYKLYQSYLAGEQVSEKIADLKRDFASTYGFDAEEQIDENMLMPQHRSTLINIKLLSELAKNNEVERNV